MDYMWMNRETGELLTRAEMRKQGAKLYDLGDDTNAVAYGEYYVCVG